MTKQLFMFSEQEITIIKEALNDAGEAINNNTCMSDDEKYNAIFPIMMTTLSIKSQEHQNVENQMSDM